MKIYTKTGDDGSTGLFGGPRVRKDSLRIEAYGTVDELNAVLGLVRSSGVPAVIDTLLQRLQNELFDLGAELASADPQSRSVPTVSAEMIAGLEFAIDACEEGLAPLKQFILPGGTMAASSAHLARTVCRRAERLAVSLAADPAEKVSGNVVVYLNRLSDLLFVVARAINHHVGYVDLAWQKPDQRN